MSDAAVCTGACVSYFAERTALNDFEESAGLA